MRDLLIEDTRFPIEAYQFVREALQFAHENLFDGELDREADVHDSPAGTSLPDELVGDEVIPEEIREELELLGDELFEEGMGDQETVRPRHITGQQLCEACRRYAVDQYGYLAKIVLASWGIRCTGDFGELVYNLIRIGQMRKSDSDRREDFDEVYDFETAFDPQFEMAIGNDAS